MFYGGNAGREALVEMCADEYVQRRTFESYLYKRMVPGEPWGDLRLLWRTVASMVRCGIIGREAERLRRLELQGFLLLRLLREAGHGRHWHAQRGDGRCGGVDEGCPVHLREAGHGRR